MTPATEARLVREYREAAIERAEFASRVACMSAPELVRKVGAPDWIVYAHELQRRRLCMACACRMEDLMEAPNYRGHACLKASCDCHEPRCSRPLCGDAAWPDEDQCHEHMRDDR